MQSRAYSSDVWMNFTRAISNKETLVGYTSDVRQFLEYLPLSDPSELLHGKSEEIENNLVRFVIHLKTNGKSVSRIRRVMAALKLFYLINRVTLNWPFILRHVGKGKTRKDKAYNHDQIRKALSVCTNRNRVLLMMYSSSGIRRGAIPELRKRHLVPIDKFGNTRLWSMKEMKRST